MNKKEKVVNILPGILLLPITLLGVIAAIIVIAVSTGYNVTMELFE